MGFIRRILNEVQGESGTDLSLEAALLGDVTLSTPLTLKSLQMWPWEPKTSHGTKLSHCMRQNIGRGHGTRNLNLVFHCVISARSDSFQFHFSFFPLFTLMFAHNIFQYSSIYSFRCLYCISSKRCNEGSKQNIARLSKVQTMKVPLHCRVRNGWWRKGVKFRPHPHVSAGHVSPW